MQEKISQQYGPVIDIALDTIARGKQALVFVNSKPSAEKQAEEISKKCKGNFDSLAEKILNVLSTPTKQCKRLAGCVVKGIAFHHAGLDQAQKELVEDAFRSGEIRIICCTPTLCLSGDAKVWHEMNETEIKKFSISNPLFVLSSNQVKMKAQKVQKIENFSKLIQISSVAGYSIKVTSKHKMFVKRGSNKVLIEASKVKKGDKIATLSKIAIKEKKAFLSNFVKDNILPVENRELTEDEFYLIGAMLGDGYSGIETFDDKIKYKGSPCIVGIDEEIFFKITCACKKLNISVRQSKNFGGTSQLVLGKNKWFREFLVRCGVEKGIKKHIANQLLYGNLNKLKFLLQGLFYTDGYVEKKGAVGFSNISEKLIKNIQKSLLRFGIVSRIRIRPAGKMCIYEKEYDTLPHLELTILNKKSILDFYKFIGFHIKRKQESLINVVARICSSYLYVSCSSCQYKIYKDLFGGRTKEQKNWGKIKEQIILLLGKNEELGSRELKKLLKHEPRKNTCRLNHHYELIQKRRIGSKSKTEWIWCLNEIGTWIYKNILVKNESTHEFLRLMKCPICSKELEIVLRGNWRDSDFEGNIFWDIVREVKLVDVEKYVYDMVLPNKPKNDHLFVAEGFFVHNSAGIDMPAFRTILTSLKRYTNHGMDYIPVLEYEQMAGRAGRPRYDDYGEAICIASTEAQKEELMEKYLHGEVENIYSKLAAEPVLRMYVLSLISSGMVRSKADMMKFFEKTFFAHQFKDLKKIEELLIRVLEMLKDWGFVNGTSEGDFVSADALDEKYTITLLGKRVAELYLDPLTANKLVEGLKREQNKTEFSYLQLISHTLEMRPLLRVKKSEYDEVQERIALAEENLLEDGFFDEFEDFENSVKTAWFFEEWVNELSEEQLLEKFGVRPGEIKYKLNIADWLLFSCIELSKISLLKEDASKLTKLRVRLKYGIKEELMPLVRLKGIGKGRARKLYNNGVKDLNGLKNVGLGELKLLIGEKTAEKIKKQLEMG